MNARFNIVSAVMLLSCAEISPMSRSILKNKAVDSIAAVGVGIGIGKIVSTIILNESLLDPDILTSVSTQALAGAAITAPIFFGWDAFQESGHHDINIDRFRHQLQDDAFRSLKTLTWQPNNASAMNDLLQAQWALRNFDARCKNRTNLEDLSLGITPAIVVPLSLTFGLYSGDTELCITGMSLSYLLAAAAVMQEKLQSHRIKKAMKECNFFDKKTISAEFLEKNKAMVAKLHEQFQPIEEDYKNHTKWSECQIKEKGLFYYPNINERINSFDKVIAKELEDFKV